MSAPSTGSGRGGRSPALGPSEGAGPQRRSQPLAFRLGEDKCLLFGARSLRSPQAAGPAAEKREDTRPTEMAPWLSQAAARRGPPGRVADWLGPRERSARGPGHCGAALGFGVLRCGRAERPGPELSAALGHRRGPHGTAWVSCGGRRPHRARCAEPARGTQGPEGGWWGRERCRVWGTPRGGPRAELSRARPLGFRAQVSQAFASSVARPGLRRGRGARTGCPSFSVKT